MPEEVATRIRAGSRPTEMRQSANGRQQPVDGRHTVGGAPVHRSPSLKRIIIPVPHLDYGNLCMIYIPALLVLAGPLSSYGSPEKPPSRSKTSLSLTTKMGAGLNSPQVKYVYMQNNIVPLVNARVNNMNNWTQHSCELTNPSCSIVLCDQLRADMLTLICRQSPTASSPGESGQAASRLGAFLFDLLTCTRSNDVWSSLLKRENVQSEADSGE